MKGKKNALYSTLIISSLLLFFTALLVAFMHQKNMPVSVPQAQANQSTEHFCDSGLCVIP